MVSDLWATLCITVFYGVKHLLFGEIKYGQNAFECDINVQCVAFACFLLPRGDKDNIYLKTDFVAVFFFFSRVYIVKVVKVA